MPDPGKAAENTFASLLKHARSRSGLTQAELAERAGLSLRTVQHLEGGHGAPYADTARRLADALELGNGERTVFELSVRRIHPASTVMVGTPVSGEPQGTGSPPQVGSDGEHKQVTVLCCQLAHHVDLSEMLGADQLLDFTHDVIHQAAEEAERHDGTVGTILGDGLVVLFGVPLAHEDHARRAIVAALAIQGRLRGPMTEGGVARKVHTFRPAEHMRITLHTGSVVVTRVGTPPNQRTSAVGQASAVASAMQAFAEPGSIIVSDVTARLLAGFARLAPLEQYAPADRGDPIRVHRLLGIGPRRSPIEGLSQSSMSPFVGREREMAVLTDVVDQVVQMGQRPATHSYGQFVGRSGDLAILEDLWTKGEGGRGQVVNVVGEPGIGKSRLIYEFRRSLGAARVTYLEGRCVSYARTTPYLPVIDLVRANCGVEDADGPPAVVGKIRFGLQEVGMAAEEHAAYILHLLGLDEPASTIQGLNPEVIKTRTFETLRNWTLAGSHKRPLVIAIEDLHWIDRSSEEYLATLVDSMAGAPILLICTWRPGYRPAWSEHSYVTQLALRPLSPTDSLTVVKSILSPEAVTALVLSILQRAEGNPFFLEELARALAEHCDSNPEVLPETVQGVLAARLDRLPEAPRRALQSASVIGREFSLRLLQAIWDQPTPLETPLQELERLEFVYDHSIGGEPGFIFKHALTQESAYASLNTRRRRRLHERIGRALLEQASDIADTQPELLARHFTEAGIDDFAIDCWQRAGDHAAERSANVEAISHFRQALGLLRNLPDSIERARRELALQIALGNPFIATKGYGAPETVETYTRARALAEQLNEPTQLFPLLYRKWVTYTIWSQQREARTAAEEFLSLAEQQADPAPRMMGHRLLGLTLFLMGELAASRAECARALDLYDAERDSALAFRYGQEPRAAIMVWTSVGLWLTGDSDRADRTMAEALAAARESGHINTLAYVVVYGCCLLESIRGNPSAIEPYLRSAFDLADEHDLAMWRAYAIAFEGWMTAARGDHDQGIAWMREGLSQMGAIGAVIFRPHLLGLLARAYAETGQVELALEALEEAIGQVETSAERWCESELYRLRAELLRRQPGEQEGEVQSCLRHAFSVAQAQGAIWLEQRVRASLH